MGTVWRAGQKTEAPLDNQWSLLCEGLGMPFPRLLSQACWATATLSFDSYTLGLTAALFYPQNCEYKQKRAGGTALCPDKLSQTHLAGSNKRMGLFV